MTTTTDFDLTYECGFDGDLGSVMSIDAHGHLSFEDADLFLADVVERELFDHRHGEGPPFGLEIEHLWRSEHPFVPDDMDEHSDDYDARWTYEYDTAETTGSIAVTRFQIASPWSRAATSPTADRAERDRRSGEFVLDGVDHYPLMCIHHPDEAATTSISAERFIDPAPEHVLDGHVHYCLPCHSAFTARLRIATEKLMAPERTAAFLEVSGDKIVAATFGFELRRSDLAIVLEGCDIDGAARRRLNAFADAHRQTGAKVHRPIASGMPGHKVLMLSDIHHLVEDYTHRAA